MPEHPNGTLISCDRCPYQSTHESDFTVCQHDGCANDWICLGCAYGPGDGQDYCIEHTPEAIDDAFALFALLFVLWEAKAA